MTICGQVNKYGSRVLLKPEQNKRSWRDHPYLGRSQQRRELNRIERNPNSILSKINKDDGCSLGLCGDLEVRIFGANNISRGFHLSWIWNNRIRMLKMEEPYIRKYDGTIFGVVRILNKRNYGRDQARCDKTINPNM